MFFKRVKTPTILQMEATECGAAALAIILGYYKRFIPLEQLRIECGVSRDGSNALNIVRAARRFGLNAQGAKIEPEDLNELVFPVIAFWEFNHFVVIEGIRGNRIYINDPATGPRTVTYQDFDHAFTGVILVFETTPNFQKAGKKPSLFASLRPQIKSIRSPLLFLILLSIALIIPGILVPAFIKIFIDNILIQQVKGWLLPLLWGMFITGVFRAVLSYLQQYYLVRLQLKITIANSAKFLWHVLRLPFSFFSQRFAGDIQSRIESNDRIASWLANDLAFSIVNLLSMLLYAIVMWFYDRTLTTIGIVVALANASLLYYVNNHLQNASSRLQQQIGKLTGIEMHGLQAIETLKATSSEDAFFQRWAGYHAQTLNSQQKIQLYSRILQIIPQLLNGLLTAAILGLGGLRIMQGELTIGGLIAFQSLLMSFNAPLLSLIALGSKLQQLRGDFMRLDDVNKHPEDLRFRMAPTISEETTTDLLKPVGDLILKEVTFGYSPLSPPLVENFSLVLKPHQKIAIVGPSGSGKSTLAKLICSLYQPWSGQILWLGKSIEKIPFSVINRSLAFVDQDIFLFEGTIRQNLTLWDDSISKQAIEQALVDAELHSVLLSHPQGLEAEVAHGGSNFSGGQRQQLEIARALTIEPSILILDEATAALDAVTEQTIIDHLKQRHCALLIITHRLSAVRDADEIIVLESGKITEQGTHEELYQLQGSYYRLMQSE